MTRLSKMLSQIKTVEGLAKLLNVSPRFVVASLAVSKDKEHLISCFHDNCKKCALYQGGKCTWNYDSAVKYFNAELSESESTDTDSKNTSIIKLRDSARELLKSVISEGFKQGHSAYTVYIHLVEYIDVLEGIGLFEENELRTYVAKDLLDDMIKKVKENNIK